jgi:hypothetical protein
LSVPPTFVEGFTTLSYAALNEAVVVLPPPTLLLLFGVEPPLFDDVLLLQPLITMAAAAAMPIAADTMRCRFISCTPLSPVVWFLAALNGDGHPGGLPDCSRGVRRGEALVDESDRIAGLIGWTWDRGRRAIRRRRG